VRGSSGIKHSFLCLVLKAVVRERAELRGLPTDLRFDVSITQVIKHITDPNGECTALLRHKASRGHRRAYPQPGSGIIRRSVFVDSHTAAFQGSVGVLAGNALTNQAEQSQRNSPIDKANQKPLKTHPRRSITGR
jgi:hypothetical protein